jgi:hypothetical protein
VLRDDGGLGEQDGGEAGQEGGDGEEARELHGGGWTNKDSDGRKMCRAPGGHNGKRPGAGVGNCPVKDVFASDKQGLARFYSRGRQLGYAVPTHRPF